jgi:tRNA (cmo5U34)-methyltransferase
MKDKLYVHPMKHIKSFVFNKDVAEVFDDMAERSIPFYKEVQQMVTNLAVTFFQSGTNIYDLGASTGTTSILLEKKLKESGAKDYRIIAVDSSGAMCRKAREKINTTLNGTDNIKVIQKDIRGMGTENCSVAILNYTLQFIPPLQREALIYRIFSSLVHNGILLVSDRVSQGHTDISRIFMEYYYDYKRNRSYTDLEISQKREALENVLIPYSFQEGVKLFKGSGFSSVDIFFSWYNFTSFLCIKR